ncbi:MAG: adenosylcobalamin-dependent ribonucleoside-diphosphate reductase [Spirochaetales bacterium]|nr:adenosylcobalamin-dependent ribonucleoside-diphosphate reductase [Spirochaetales bacterium]
MKIRRHFTKKGKSPYGGITFTGRSTEIKNPDGTVIFRQDDVTVPEGWSQIASDILAQKYFRKSGVPLGNGKTGGETDARQVFHRLAHTWKTWGRRFGYFDTDEDAGAFYDEICYMLARQTASPNSPQWFNTGLFEVYGIKGPPQGHFFVNQETGECETSKSAYERPQPHACFILSLEDDLLNKNGIMDLFLKEARLFKYGSGTGTNYSNIRGKSEPLSGGGVSSGLLSFLKVGDRSASSIKSGGTTRRAAKMVCLDADHPDIEEFIEWKVREEFKVAAMVAGSGICVKHAKRILAACTSKEGVDDGNGNAPEYGRELSRAVENALTDHVPPGYILNLIRLAGQGVTDQDAESFGAFTESFSAEWEGSAYQTVSGQASNNSVRLSNLFMRAVEEDGEWDLIRRTDGSVSKRIRAGTLFEKIALSAWQCADPAVQFHTTINEWHTCPEGGEIRASNPCSEYMFLDDSACNLASINLAGFYNRKKESLDIPALMHAISLWTVVLDISVGMAHYPGREIAQNSHDYRTLGLGFANLGTMLMLMGLPYDSREGRNVAAAVASLLTGRSYATSALLAREMGPYPRYEANKEHMLRVIRNHRRAAAGAHPDTYEGLGIAPKGLEKEGVPEELYEAAVEAWDTALEDGMKYGFRNAQVSAIAPTGTIGLVMDCDTTGIEPDFSLVKFKRLSGGGSLKIINTSIPPALKKLGYREKQIREIVRFCLGHGTLEGSPAISYETLKEKGFTDELLGRIERLLPSAFSITHIFTEETIGGGWIDEHLDIPQAVRKAPGFSLLKALGFSDVEIEAADRYACGTFTVEGAPHLREKHYPVFDTANPGGKTGTRFISWRAHIEMMAAVQPFISGAISKTINMPQSVTIGEVKETFLSSWKKMLKSISIYRDGSKLSQPLYSSYQESDPALRIVRSIARRYSKNGKAGGEDAVEAQSRAESRREPLPSRRNGYTQKARIGGHSIFLRTGEYSDGRLGEIFLDMYKEGAAFRSLLNSFAIAVSLGLQYGVPLQELVDAFTFTRFEPNGVVAGHENIKMATSVLDFIFRDLALNYLKRTDLVQVKPDDLIATSTMTADDPKEKENDGVEEVNGPEHTARLKGYEGEPCSFCGHFTLIRNGTCLKCETCGSTTGCS